MKRIICLLLCATIATIIFAQNQQGLVKTRGRVVNGQVVPGQQLTGATITLTIGNPLVSGNNGSFSFNVPSGKNYSLVTAIKQGYTLADPEYTRRSFAYSAENTFYVVLEDEAQRQADINAATRKVRRTLTAQLQAREDEIEELKEQNKLTEEEYQNRLKVLYDNQSKSEQLVKEMAERYASTDYDQLDDFNRQVQMYIEEGELQKADSMIRSKGDIAQRVAEYQSVVAANQKARQELEKSEAGAAKTYADLSQDLKRKSDIFLQQFMQDSALYCLKVRAELDTTNIEAVRQYAELCSKQKQFDDCEKYWMICLRAYIRNNDAGNIALIQNNLGALYSDIYSFDSGRNYLEQALATINPLFEASPDIYRSDLSRILNNLGRLYFVLQDYPNSEKYYLQSLDHKNQLFTQNPEAYRADIASSQNNIGAMYFRNRDFANCEKYYKLSLENYDVLCKQDPDAYRDVLADLYNNLGTLYETLRDFANSEKYHKLSLEMRQYLYDHNPNAYREELAMSQSNLGNVYIYLQDFAQSEKYYKLSLEKYEILFRQNPNVYRASIINLQNNLGALYMNIGDFDNSEKYYKLSMENIDILFKQNPDAYKAQLAMAQLNMGLLYRSCKKYDDCEQYYKLALANYESLFAQNPQAYIIYLAIAYNSVAYLYADKKQFDEAIAMADKAITMLPIEANFYDSKGEILLMQGKNEEALEVWKKVLEVDPDFLKKYPGGSDFYKGLKKLGLIE